MPRKEYSPRYAVCISLKWSKLQLQVAPAVSSNTYLIIDSFAASLKALVGVAREVIEALVSQKHDIIVLSRNKRVQFFCFSSLDVLTNQLIQDTLVHEVTPGVDWAQVDYDNPKQLEQTLHRVHTLLSFVVIQDDPASTAQKNLIDAAVRAGVKRFAPSEWAT